MIVRERRAWRMFVESFTHGPYRITQEHVGAVLRHWDFLEARFVMGSVDLHPPVTQVLNENVSMVWNTKTRVFELEVAPDGKIYWFYRNRMSREIAGTEDEGEVEVSEEAVKRLRSVLQVFKRTR